MGKMKPHKGLSKRVKVTATGKIKRHCSGNSHLMRTKNAKRRTRLASPSYLTGTLCKKILAQLGR
jgi:large subunit ribosomal protein L35